jgi:hypothetical protein
MAIVHLCLALLLGVAMHAEPLLTREPILRNVVPVYYHLLMVGWATQLIFAVAHWMFPRHTREQPRGNEGWMGFVFFTLNGGLLVRAVSEPMASQSPTPFWAQMLGVAALLQWLAGMAFILAIWKRVKEK